MHKSGLCLSIALLAALFLCSEGKARDFGTLGQTWAIAEDDLLAHIKRTATAFAESGALKAWQSQAAARAQHYVSTPPAVVGITDAIQHRSWRHDPSIRVRRDLHTPSGDLLARAGTLINPLDYMSLSTELLFIDGANPTQVNWALSQTNPAKIVLVNGPVADLIRRHKTVFFFDQKGLLTRHFDIQAVPARLHQDGSALLIEEIALTSAQSGGTDQ